MVRLTALLVLVIGVCSATIIPRLSFEDLVAKSDQIVTGHVARQWTSWGPEHRFIWTRTEIAVEGTLKGAGARMVTVSELGGELDGREMVVAGSVSFSPGEHVALFLHKGPTGDLRPMGWTQGKFLVDAKERIHPASGQGLDLLTPSGFSGTDLRSLEGASLQDLRTRVLLLSGSKGSKK
jgi:hypothetical protein